MARRVFFSFNFSEDYWRAGVVRNHWITKPNRESAGYFDAATWEKVQKQSTEAIKRWIREQMKGTSVTVVLIGANTASRYFVRYEIQHSWDTKKGLLGIRIHDIKDQAGNYGTAGADPFDAMGFKNFRVYDWMYDDGYNNFGSWVESAAQRVAGRTSS